MNTNVVKDFADIAMNFRSTPDVALVPTEAEIVADQRAVEKARKKKAKKAAKKAAKRAAASAAREKANKAQIAPVTPGTAPLENGVDPRDLAKLEAFHLREFLDEFDYAYRDLREAGPRLSDMANALATIAAYFYDDDPVLLDQPEDTVDTGITNPLAQNNLAYQLSGLLTYGLCGNAKFMVGGKDGTGMATMWLDKNRKTALAAERGHFLDTKDENPKAAALRKYRRSKLQYRTSVGWFDMVKAVHEAVLERPYAEPVKNGKVQMDAELDAALSDELRAELAAG